MIVGEPGSTDGALPPHGVIWTSAAGCERAKLGTPPGWTVSGAWSPQGTTLLLIDRRYDKILLYQKNGRCLGTIADDVKSSFEGFFPSRIAVRGSDFILGLSYHRFLTLDSGFTPKQQTSIRSAVRGPRQVDSSFMWQVTAADALTYSDYKQPEGWRSGFMRLPLNDPSRFEILGDDMPTSDSSRVFYRLGNQYIAALGETGYILRMDPEMRIVSNNSGSNALVPLAAFPPGSRELPPPPEFHSFKDTRAVMHYVETTSMPLGIYGWKDYLYVVSHYYQSGTSMWRISKIDPRQDSLVGYSTIPAHAAHLTIIPGPLDWSFLEKGPIYKFGEETAETILHVPTRLIEGISAPDEGVCEAPANDPLTTGRGR